jgi:hypothetical protein
LVERLVWDQEVVGSNPTTPTTLNMPYIKSNRRQDLDPLIDNLTTELKYTDNWQGDLNYTITKLIHSILQGNINYSNINNAVGVLECAKLELYRRLAAPYEDTKIIENGDVY